MSDFGDYTVDDAFDTAPADPEQVARKLHQLRRREGYEIIDWDNLTAGERGRLIQMIVVLLAWGRRGGIFR